MKGQELKTWRNSCWVYLFFVYFLFPTEEEHLESRSEGVRPGEEILGVPLTPMEPQHAHTQTHTSPHIFSETLAATTAHTLILTHTRACTHTHADTIEVSGVLAGPVGGWGDFFFFSFCFFNLFISCLFLVNWGTLGTGVGDGCNTSTALLRALAHHCISDDTVDIYWVCRSHSCPLWTEAATKEWCQDNNSQKSSY